ncbi:unnamed protein product [Bursaphelenchus okinawaensis]|uniref:Uncharacterized protein n=1 Tax=Bursaphelenchus okinawaensis TaxID=465554 RepID=A0A811LRY4_9BILA|nr:unnamed protein product [Bursaphelenchus okinawaensis]CAG9127864.1 unnamed protein product [Bursaphelenchus okinawaensis]
MGRKVWAAVKKKFKKLLPKRQEEKKKDENLTNRKPSFNEDPEDSSRTEPIASTKGKKEKSSKKSKSTSRKKSTHSASKCETTKAQSAIFVGSNAIHQPGKKNTAKLNVQTPQDLLLDPYPNFSQRRYN